MRASRSSLPATTFPRSAPGARRPAQRSRGRGVRRASAIAAVLLCAVGGFALTAYLLHAERRGPAAQRLAAQGAAGPSAASSRRGARRAPPPLRPAAIAVAPGAPQARPARPRCAPWLARLNHYRSLAGLPPVAEDPALSEGDALHARYLVKSYAEAIRRGGIGGEAHEENRASPWYTVKGARRPEKPATCLTGRQARDRPQPGRHPIRPIHAGRDAVGLARMEHRRMGRDSVPSL